MSHLKHSVEVVLHPGDFYFGDAGTRIRTTLGSCVSITMWHPGLLIGGMCHFQLPSRPRGYGQELDGHYADEAMQMFLREIKAVRTCPAEYQVKLFGGGQMFRSEEFSKAGLQNQSREKLILPDKLMNFDSCLPVSAKNVLAAQALVALHGFRIAAQDLGGEGHRQLFFDICDGHAWVRKPVYKL